MNSRKATTMTFVLAWVAAAAMVVSVWSSWISQTTPMGQSLVKTTTNKKNRTSTIELQGEENTTIIRTDTDTHDKDATLYQPVFVPFPHHAVGVGEDAKCQWMAPPKDDEKDPSVKALLGPDRFHPDSIQQAALRETSCVGGGERQSNNVHIFSTVEAWECWKDISLLLSGDSYTRHNSSLDWQTLCWRGPAI